MTLICCHSYSKIQRSQENNRRRIGKYLIFGPSFDIWRLIKKKKILKTSFLKWYPTMNAHMHVEYLVLSEKHKRETSDMIGIQIAWDNIQKCRIHWKMETVCGSDATWHYSWYARLFFTFGFTYFIALINQWQLMHKS